MTPALHLCALSVRRQGRTVLHPLTALCPAGTVTGILGPNGAGKSTFLKAVAGLLPITGRVMLGGDDLAGLSPQDRARRIGYLPQDHRLHWPITVREVVRLGLLAAAGHDDDPIRVDQVQVDQARVNQAMADTDVTALANRPATALSGGERARVHLARVLAGSPAVILADEPVAALDPAHQITIMALLRRQAVSAGRCVVLVLHDLTLAARFCDQVILLQDGRMTAADSPRQAMTPERLETLYGTRFLTGTLDGQPVILPTGSGDQASSSSSCADCTVTTETSASAPGPTVTATASPSTRAVCSSVRRVSVSPV